LAKALNTLSNGNPRISDHLDKIERMHRIMEQIQPMQRQWEEFKRISEIQKEAYQSLFNTRLKKELETFKQVMQKYSETTEALKNDFAPLSESFSSSLKNMLPYKNKIESLQSILHSLLPERIDSIILPQTRIKESLAEITTLSKQFKPPTFLTEYAYQNTFSYQKFASEQLERINAALEPFALKRAQIVDQVGELFDLSEESITSAYIISEKIEEKEEKEEKEKSSKLKPNLYPTINQHISYVYRKGKNMAQEELEDALDNSYPAKICTSGSQIIKLIIAINKHSETKYLESLFKPTTSLMEFCHVIPTLISKNERDFAEIINLLYFAIYEGSGSAKRLLKVLNDRKLETLWQLKQIRLDIFHDVNHGKSSEVKNKREKIRDAYRFFIGKSRPTSEKDFVKAQYAIYKNLLGMLTETWRTIAA